ncbi:ParA family protein, partial [Enterococcus hirae]|uniref:ParA family protein n=1 Tax=Enterococcus hirae TaxID=1354 RepID=UPI00136A9B5B
AATIGATNWAGIDLAAATPELVEVDADSGPLQPQRLRKALTANADVLARYDLVLLDCPPSLGRLLLAALVAASDLLIVTEPATHSLQGVQRIEESAEELREGFNQATPHLAGIIVNRAQRTSDHQHSEAELRQAYGQLVLPGAIPLRTAVPDAANRGIPIHDAIGDGALAVSTVLSSMWRNLQPRLHPFTAITTRSV